MTLILTSIYLLLVFFVVLKHKKGDVFEAVLYSGLLMLVAGVASLFCLSMGWSAAIPPALLIVFSLLLRKQYALSVKQLVSFMVVTAAAFGSWFVQGGIMYSKKQLPDLLFNVDTAFTLNILNSINKAGQIPFQSLENLGTFNKYHYGSHAILSGYTELFGGVALNHLLFWVCLFALFIASVAFLLVERLGTVQRKWQPVVVLLLLTSANLPLYNIFNSNTLKNVFMFNGGYPLFQNVVGSFLTLAIILFILNATEKSSKIYVAGILLGILPLFKVPYVPLVAFGFGLSTLLLFYKTKKRSFLVALLLGIALSASCMFLSLSLSDTHTEVRFGPSELLSRHDWFGMVVWLVPIPFFFMRQKSISRLQAIHLFFALPIPLLFLVINLNDENAWQLFSLSPFFSMLALMSFWPQLKDKKSLFVNRVALIVLPILIIKHMSNELSYSCRVLMTPELGHEYANLRAMNQVLQKIPVKETTLAATDMHYPAENYKRNYRPFHIALGGHQCYNADITYMTSERYRNEVLELFKISNAPNLHESAREKGITHLIVNDNPTSIDVLFLAAPLRNTYHE